MTRNPISAPIATAIAAPSNIAAQAGSPPTSTMRAMHMPEKAIIDPMERSNSPAIISRHAPIDTTPR